MDHVKLQDLILVYEDLTDEERRLADEHLLSCASCRDMLKAVQAAEQVSLDWTDLPADPDAMDQDPLTHLDAVTQAQGHLSREQLLNRLALSRKNRWRLPAGLGGLALAATLALLVWSPWQTAETLLVMDLRVTSQSVVRGQNSAPAAGEAIALRYQQMGAGWPVVVRVRENESPQLLLPTETQPTFELQANRPVVLPPADSDLVWHLADTPRRETYLVAISAHQPPSVKQLQALLADHPDSSTLRARLERDLGPVSAVDVVSDVEK